jgi:hypothetical protein
LQTVDGGTNKPMPNKKQHKLRCINLGVEARGGVNFASDSIADESRARMNCSGRIIGIMKPYLGTTSRVSDDLAITNILSDLRHYCDGKGLHFRELDKAARGLYLQEKADEGEWPVSSSA